MPRPTRYSVALAAGLAVVSVVTVAVVALMTVRGDRTTDPSAAISTAVEAPAPRYLALGDSVAVGVGATNPRLSGYVALVRDALATRLGRGDVSRVTPAIDATNLAVGGETTASLIQDGQLARAVDLLERGDDASRQVITLTIGGNDAVTLLRVCGANPESQPTAGCRAAADATLGTLHTNLITILSRLRQAAGPDALIVVSTYYNSLQNPSCLVNQLASLAAPIVGRLNAVIEDAAAAVEDVRVADVATAGIGPADLRADCLHPNDSGYARIADAFLEAVEAGAAVR